MPSDPRFDVPHDTLIHVRSAAHSAVQWPSRAARANLDAADDDSHSSLSWSDRHNALLSQPLDGRGHQLGFSFDDAALIWLADGDERSRFQLTNRTEGDVKAFCDARLAEAGLKDTGHANMPYTLPDPSYRTLEHTGALRALGAWFGQTHSALASLIESRGHLALAKPRIRCWPHHFDLAALFVLTEDNPETARSVGIGLSPGDDSYGDPYFYCTPWPKPDALPSAELPWHWHTKGFTSLVCPIGRLDEIDNIIGLLTHAFDYAYALVRP